MNTFPTEPISDWIDRNKPCTWCEEDWHIFLLVIAQQALTSSAKSHGMSLQQFLATAPMPPRQGQGVKS